jgi:hypothetical protein
MQRLLAAAVAAGTLLLLGGCGGGASAPNPQNGGNGEGDNSSPGVGFELGNVYGTSSSSVLPNQLNVRTSADDATLSETLAKFGYTLLHRNGEFATVGVQGDLDSAIRTLNKEYVIADVDKVHVFNTPNVVPRMNPAAVTQSKLPSYMPLDPMVGETFEAIGFGGAWGMFIWTGQGWPLNSMSFFGAWDTSMDPTVAAVPVRVAIIDAGFQDYSATVAGGIEDIDPAMLDAAQSGSVDAAGTFTPGLAEAAWDLTPVDVGDVANPFWVLRPFHDHGGVIFTTMASQQNTRRLQGNDLDGGGGDLTADEIWSEGIAGLNPNATYILIKTGTQAGQSWSFNDNEISASIDHAVTAGANIIVLGMAGNGPVGANVSASIAAARAADALVIAPAGDTLSTYNITTNAFDTQPVDIQASPVNPGSDPNCVSVAATGFGRYPLLPDQEVNPGPPPVTIPDTGNGWFPNIVFNPGPTQTRSALSTFYASVAPYSNYNATIAAMGYGVPQIFHPYFTDPANTGDGTSAASPLLFDQGAHYGGGNFMNPFDGTDFGSHFSAAYVAGAASMVYQALAVANGGTFPADVDTVALDTLVNNGDFAPLARIDDTFTETAGANPGGLLNANKAMNQAISGGTLYSDPMAFTLVQLDEPLTAITVSSPTVPNPVQLTVNIINGTGPFDISVDWGDGNGPQVTTGWVPGTLVSLAGGYTTLGPKALTVIVTDSNSQTITASAELFVINPLTASILVTDQAGTQVALTSLQLATTYVFEVRANNLYTGTYDDDANPATPEVPNTTTYEWDFDSSGGAPDATGTAPNFAYPTPGAKTITLTVREDFRPDQVFTINVTVS